MQNASYLYEIIQLGYCTVRMLILCCIGNELHQQNTIAYLKKKERLFFENIEDT